MPKLDMKSFKKRGIIGNELADVAGEHIMLSLPFELNMELITHIANADYTEIAIILSREAKKYIDRTKIDSFNLVNTKLNDFKDSVKDMIGNRSPKTLIKIANKLEEIEGLLPKSMIEMNKIFVYLKFLFKGTAEYKESDSLLQTNKFLEKYYKKKVGN